MPDKLPIEVQKIIAKHLIDTDNAPNGDFKEITKNPTFSAWFESYNRFFLDIRNFIDEENLPVHLRKSSHQPLEN